MTTEAGGAQAEPAGRQWLPHLADQPWFPNAKVCANCGEAIDLSWKFGAERWVHCRTTLTHCAIESPVATPTPAASGGSDDR